jgi:murein tripeptide amidase MpaA
MQQTGVDLCLDIHGDETLPYVFVAGSEGTPGYSPRVADLEVLFKSQWMTACPDFQDSVNYGQVAAGSANLSLATNWVAQQFGCLAFTVEMPFKDNALQPDPVQGWSAARSRALGASVLTPILATL